MAKLFNISLAGQYPPLNNRINHFDRLLAQKIGDSGVITTATGNPVSIVTNRAQNAISTLLSYSPKQSGSGTPSPQNIQPIEGWTEYDLTVNGNRITESLGGTYYGFTVDLENGTATIDRTVYTFTGNETFYKQEYGRIAFPLPNQYRVTGARDQLCSYFGGDNVTSGTWGYVVAYGVSVEEFKAYCQNGDVAMTVPLAEPITLTLTPQTVALLKGSNTLWTDGDEISITYKAKR